MTTPQEAPALQIVLRYLNLLFNPDAGLHVLVPAANHRALLRDTSTDAVIPLSEALIRVEVGRKPLPPAPTRLEHNGLLVALEKTLKLKHPIAPDPSFLDTAKVSAALNALVILPGGTIQAQGCEAFPERSAEMVRFEFGTSNVLTSQITDTTLYHLPLPSSGEPIELVIVTPRRTYRIDISDGARLELRNEDEKFGRVPEPNQYHAEELREILRFIGEPGQIECDTFACASFFCGDRQGVAN